MTLTTALLALAPVVVLYIAARVAISYFYEIGVRDGKQKQFESHIKKSLAEYKAWKGGISLEPVGSHETNPFQAPGVFTSRDMAVICRFAHVAMSNPVYLNRLLQPYDHPHLEELRGKLNAYLKDKE